MKEKKPTAKAVAAELCAVLKSWEANPAVNTKSEASGLHRFWKAGAYPTGRFVRVTYIAFQNSTALTIAEAQKYLDWIRAGNIGQHYRALGV